VVKVEGTWERPGIVSGGEVSPNDVETSVSYDSGSLLFQLVTDVRSQKDRCYTRSARASLVTNPQSNTKLSFRCDRYKSHVN
jgi:hypothetical protein